MFRRHALAGFLLLAAVIGQLPGSLAAHDHSRKKAEQQRAAALRRAAESAAPRAATGGGSCRLTLRLRDAAGGAPLPGLVRITHRTTGKALPLSDEIHRELNWYSLAADASVSVPQGSLRVEAFHGIESERTTRDLELGGQNEAVVDLPLRRFYDPRQRGWHGGNTHLHLMKITYLEALRYLQLVPRTDGLDLVFLSHLRRVPDERDYVSNQIVENSFGGGELHRLSQEGVLLGNGQEHRHNFGKGGEGYGHVMLLDLARLIHPVSIGPGIMGSGTDGRPLQTGIREARADGATVIWCHNTFGFEDVPNWMSGMLHAQNIFDGGNHGSYKDSFYRYLNLGMRVPFSTGTDWFIYDFSRVYVPVAGELTTKAWLAGLQSGRSFITNGTFLEFTVNERPVGESLSLPGPGDVRIRARGVGRSDFSGLELIHNGDVVRRIGSQPREGHFFAEGDWMLAIDQPGWLALRIPLEAGRNEFEKPLFAHTSAVYVELAGRRIFRSEVARELVQEMEANIETIRNQAQFGGEAERDSVLNVHRAGISRLRERLVP